MTQRTWLDYVLAVIPEGTRQVDIARASGIDQTTVSRWMNGESRSITPASVAKFARAYDRPVLEAFVEAGFLSEKEAGIRVRAAPNLAKISSDALMRELARRLDQSDDAAAVG
jgi:transcriptional regulator with XRE-family HTH domain